MPVSVLWMQVPAEMWAEFYRLRGDKLADILTTFRSTADYAKHEDPQHWPCCDVDEPACRCPNPPQTVFQDVFFRSEELGPDM
jgi:hypothetical protein